MMRRRILNAAATCFAASGFDRTRTADICAAARVSSGNLFHYFPSKQAIFTAIFEQDGRTQSLELAAATATDDPLWGLCAFIRRYTAQAEDPRLAGLMFEMMAR